MSMSYLSVTINNINEIEELRKLSIKEIQLALKNSAFSSNYGFSYEEILNILNDNKDMNICINMNGLIKEDEIEEKEEIMLGLLDKGISYISFSDFALLRKAKMHNYTNSLIYDPITLLTNSLEAQTIADNNLAYITISSLLTKDEIKEIASAIDNASLIIHGHLLMSATRRKLLSSYGNNKNIGLKDNNYYLQEETRDGLMPIYESDRGTLIYSDFIQESFMELNEFVSKGIKRLEIHTNYIDFDITKKTIRAYQDILNGKDPKEVEKEYRLSIKDELLSEGYYDEKSIK